MTERLDLTKVLSGAYMESRQVEIFVVHREGYPSVNVVTTNTKPGEGFKVILTVNIEPGE